MDTIGDFCTCIRNAILAGKEKVDVPSSNMRKNIANKLEQYGYIRGYRVVEDGKQGVMRLYLKYDERKTSIIQSIQRLSRPSCRRYIKADQIQDVRSGYGLTIISTNQGVLSGREAKKKKVGGELLCEIW
ncbi:MAG: 30S ribosomal protein S8 [Bdellovibrionaceae bacterium]|nr:30S ribosomal protein S8 [Pseudobdellovibrionaceae bacterium]